MPVSKELCGVLLMICTGVFVTCEMVTSKVIDHKGWPYWYLLACACLVASLATGAVLWFLGTGLPSSSELKWVLSRSIFGDLHWYLAILAVILGAAPGDVAALTSIDITAAALLGLVFLGEKARIFRFCAWGLGGAT